MQAEGNGAGLPADMGVDVAEISERLRRLENRDWWLWASSIAVMLLLTMAVGSFSLPAMITDSEAYKTIISQSVRGLAALVFLFNLYVIWQQILIKRLRREMARQIAATARSHTLMQQLHELTLQDPLTGLYNRRFLDQHLPLEVARSDRHGYSLTALMIDLIGFKQVNDAHGHAAGDVVLREFSERLKQAIRGSDVAVRIGGDEFLVILPRCTPAGLPNVLGRLSNLEFLSAGTRVALRFSAGWALYRPGETPEQLLARADTALYEDKRKGALSQRARMTAR